MLASAVGLLTGSAHSAGPIGVGTRYRKLGDSTWREGLPLLRVWPETVSAPVPRQFAGSIFDLTPDTDYEIELSATDPDGGSATKTATAKTRPVRRTQPAAPNAVNVTNVTALESALEAAKAGDLITLAVNRPRLDRAIGVVPDAGRGASASPCHRSATSSRTRASSASGPWLRSEPPNQRLVRVSATSFGMLFARRDQSAQITAVAKASLTRSG